MTGLPTTLDEECAACLPPRDADADATSRRCDELLSSNVVTKEEIAQANNTFTKLLNHFETVGFAGRFEINLN